MTWIMNSAQREKEETSQRNVVRAATPRVVVLSVSPQGAGSTNTCVWLWLEIACSKFIQKSIGWSLYWNGSFLPWKRGPDSKYMSPPYVTAPRSIPWGPSESSSFIYVRRTTAVGFTTHKSQRRRREKKLPKICDQLEQIPTFSGKEGTRSGTG